MDPLELDPGRRADLDIFATDELRKIAADVITAIEGALAELAGEHEVSDLGRSAGLAHGARNEALLIGARELGEGLRAVEQAARRSDRDGLDAALRSVAGVWPPTRAAIEALTAAH